MIATKSKLNIGKVIKVEECAKDTFLLEFYAQESFNSNAGQFISIFCNKTLRRPFSIFKQDKNKISILFRKKGDGTQFLSRLKKDDSIDFSGPFGNHFEIINKPSILIGAGLGVAPISYLKNELDNLNIKNIFIAGFQSENDIPTAVENIDLIMTDDGTKGNKGNVIQGISTVFQDIKPEIIYACGPRIVLKKVSEFASMNSIESYVSMENMMACSIGVCRGCVIDIKQSSETVKKSVCKDGPVFKGSEVIW